MNFGGYEIVRELSRSPVGFEATARGPDGGAEAYFVQVQYFDPIARRGEERVLVDAFLERTRLQQKVDGGHWAKVHAVGEIDQGAFAVSELFPRNGQGIIDGKARLASTDLQRVVLGVLDGLIELRERAGGRAHGALKPEKVLVDDSAGTGRWRVALRDPAPDAWSAAELEQAKLRDARGVGGLLIGMVEHRQPRVLPTRIEQSDPWARVGGSQADAWVKAVNRLLDADLNPSSDWLAEARDAFAAIKVFKQKRSKAPMLVGGVVVLALLAGGGYFAMTQLGRDKEREKLVDELTPEVWQNWLEACAWVPSLEPLLDRQWPDGGAGSLSPEAQAFLKGIKAALPARTDITAEKEPLKDAWRPHFLFNKVSLDEMFVVGEDGTRTANDALRASILESNPRAVEKANIALLGVRDVRATLGTPPVKADIETLRSKLVEWGATEEQVGGLTGAIASLTPGEVNSTAQVIALVEAVDAGARSKSVGAALSALESRATTVMNEAGPGARDDRVLSKLPEAVRKGVVGSLEAASDAPGSYRAIEAAVAAGNAELDRLSKFLADRYALVVLPELESLVESAGLSVEVGFDAIDQWRKLASDPRVVRLPSERDELDALRSPAGVESLLKPARDLVGQLDELARTSGEPEVRDAVPGYRATVAEVEGLIASALSVPATDANEAEIRRLAGAFKGKLRDMQASASVLYRKYSKTLDQVEEILAGMDAAFPDDRELHDAFLASRATLTGLLREARSLPESEQGRRASELVDQYQKEFDRLEAIRRHTARALQLVASPALDPSPLRTAFESRRSAFQRELIAGSGAPGSEPNAALEAMASEIEAATAAAAGLGARLERWASAADLTDQAGVLAPSFTSDAGLAAAFTAATAPLRTRLDAFDRVSGTPAELLGIARDAAAPPEQRRAAFERIGALNTAWPATGADLRLVLDAQRAIVGSLAPSQDALWTEAQVGAIGAAAWERAMASAATEAAFVEVRAMASDFGLGAQAEARLSETVRKNAALVDLKQAFERIPETKDDATDEAAVGAAVNAWLAANRSLFAGDTALIANLEKALVSEGEGGGDFDPRAYGPGRAGWSGSIDEALQVISYASGSNAMAFRRVETTDEETVWFLSTREVPLGLFLSVAGGSLNSDLDGYADQGPRGWLFDRSAGASDARGWFEYRPLGNDHLLKDPLFDAGLRDNQSPTALSSENDAGKDGDKERMPVQHISRDAADAFCTAMFCELPTEEVWLAAAKATFEAAGSASIAVNASTVSALGLQVRDSTWGTQHAYFNGLPINDEKRWEEHKWWYLGGFRWGLATQAYEAGIGETWPVDDGLMYFGPVDSGPQALWSHIVGNVGELVVTPSGLAAIGASAMSPPSIDPSTAIQIRRVTELPAADIGLRPAFRVPAQALNPTVYRKVQVLLGKTQLSLPGGT